MDFARQQRDPTRHLVGITAVILVHALVVYALVTGLGKKAIEVIKKPLTATIVEEIKAPPPPPPPPPKKIEIPKVPPPEMPYVPPPDVPVPTVPQEPVIAAVAPTPPPAPPVIAPPAPPAPPPPKPAVVRNPSFLNDCSPSMPGEAIRRNIEGEVTAHLYVDEKGNVTDVKIIKAEPPKIFDRAVIGALSQCKFQASGDKWIGEVPLSFKLQ
ncbi:MAG TPA: energy transducer TonB [Casimicrobiaceae bacterium]|nr:energy transducer TonB [Casimicrobiaceae bacterium]